VLTQFEVEIAVLAVFVLLMVLGPFADLRDTAVAELEDRMAVLRRPRHD